MALLFGVLGAGLLLFVVGLALFIFYIYASGFEH